VSFEEFWQYVVGRGTVDDAVHRQLAANAWDAALCAATAGAFDAGKLRPAGEMMRGISALHTWTAGEEGGGE